MASLFAGVLSVVSSIISNGVSTFSLLGFWDETECPKEML